MAAGELVAAGVIDQRHLSHGILWNAARQCQLGRHLEHGVFVDFACNPYDHLSRAHEFARLGTLGGDDAVHVAFELGVCNPVLGGSVTCLRGVQLRLRGL